ncbi:MAG: FAD-dependent oxidoreductase, partial [Acidobacteria bacterium]|nr:FAD-dependent oxidoreductase [Acidobacteriota bacterium]
MTEHTDVLILGAGASGLMCALEAAKRGRKVLVIDRAGAPGGKILVSGGGKCNFTNRTVSPEDYVSGNPRFCTSALSRYTNHDFIALVEKHGIPYEEREHGRLFCLRSSRDILGMLLSECQKAGAVLRLNTEAGRVEPVGEHRFAVHAGGGNIECESLVIATGGMGGLGYEIARAFGLAV